MAGKEINSYQFLLSPDVAPPLLLLTLVGSVLLLRRWERRSRMYQALDKIPSFPRLYFLGHLHILVKEVRRVTSYGGTLGAAMFNFTMMMARKFKEKGICFVDMGLVGGAQVHIFCSKLVKGLLTSKTTLDKPIYFELVHDHIGPNNLLLSGGQRWKEDHKTFTPPFSSPKLGKFVEPIQRIALDLCGTVQQLGGKCKDLEGLVSFFVLRTLVVKIFGVDSNVDEESLRQYIEDSKTWEECLKTRLSNPLYRYEWIYKLSPTGRLSAKAVKRIRSFCAEALNNRIRERNYQGGLDVDQRDMCILDILITEQEKNPELYTEEYIVNHISAIVYAGIDTTTTTLTWTLMQLAMSPKCQEKAQEVVDDLTQEGEDLNVSKINSALFLKAVIYESLRITPPAFFIGRRVDEDLQLGDYTIPAGSSVFLNLWQLHRDPEVFPCPETYNPERFLKEERGSSEDGQDNGQEEVVIKMVDFGHSFKPFSGGARKCIGEMFAMIEIRVFLITILKRYTICTDMTMDQFTFEQAGTLKWGPEIEVTFVPRLQ